MNKSIDKVNVETGNLKFEIIGDYDPGNFYGNVRTNRLGHPLRPIISQIPRPT